MAHALVPSLFAALRISATWAQPGPEAYAGAAQALRKTDAALDVICKTIQDAWAGAIR